MGSQPWVKDYLAALEKASGGRLQITWLKPGEHPYKSADTLAVVRDRLAEMVYNMISFATLVEPLMAAVELPWLQGGAGAEERFDTFNKLRPTTFDPIMDKWNQLSLLEHTFVGEHFEVRDRFVLKLDDFKGLKMRGFSRENSMQYSILGATPLTIQWADFYSAAQTGMVDGVAISLGTLLRSGFFDFFKYITRADYFQPFLFMAVNKDAFNELPKDLQDIVRQVSAQYATISQKIQADDDAYSNLQAMEVYGVRTTSMSPTFKEQIMGMMQPVWDDWAQRTGPGAAELVQQVKGLHQEWVKAHPPK